MRVRAALVGFGLLVIGTSASAQAVDPALMAAIAARDQAGMARDADEYAKYTAPDWFAINPAGQLVNRAQRLFVLGQPAEAGAAQPDPLREESVRMYGPSAAVARMKTDNNRQLMVWVRTPQGWQATALHIVPDAVPDPATPAAQPQTAPPSGPQAPAGLSGDGAAVFEAFTQIQDAIRAEDWAAYERLTAPEYVRLSSGGLVRVRSDFSGAVQQSPGAQPAMSNVTVQVWGSIAVVRSLQTAANGVQQWLTRVFANTTSGWHQVASAFSRVGSPPTMLR